MENNKKYTFKIEGGIGDLIFAIPGFYKIKKLFGEDNIECILLTHYKDADSFLERFGIKIKKFYYYSNNSQLVSILQEIRFDKDLEDENYIGDAFSFRDKITESLWQDLKDLDGRVEEHWKAEEMIGKTINKDFELSKVPEVIIYGIHPFGSNFSNDFLTRSANLPSKNIPKEAVAKIIKELYYINKNSMFIIFGSKKEEDDMMNYLYKTCEHICLMPAFKNELTLSLAMADICTFVVAADSAIKSISCMHEIPTLVFLGDYQDKPRDCKFIDPFIEEGILKVIRYEDKINGEHVLKLRDIFLYEREGSKWKNTH